MELLHLEKKLPYILLHMLLISSHFAVSQVQYFINCGSSDNATLNNRVFVRDDKNTDTFELVSHHSKTFHDSNQSADPTYSSARVFSKPSYYQFNIPKNVKFCILRLHFKAFWSTPSLAEAEFNVSASGHMLLPGFSVGASTKNSTPDVVFKEFFISINDSSDGRFRVHFVPIRKDLPLAFVNAIEVLSTDVNMTEVTGLHVMPRNTSVSMYPEMSKVLETIYRINVGGNEVTSDEDNNRWRTWVPDDPFLVTKEAAANESAHEINIEYDRSAAASSDYDAPSNVYQTAKQLNLSSKRYTNLTWMFNVNKGAEFLVRLHFCDFISSGISDSRFNLSIYGKFMEKIDPYNMNFDLQVPFYRDYIVWSGDSELMDISLRRINVTFLNGVEIMEVKNGSAEDNPVDTSNGIGEPLMIGLIVGSIPLIVAIVLAVMLVVLKRRKGKPVKEFEWEMVQYSVAQSSHNRSSDGSSSHENLHLCLKIPIRHIRKVTRNFDDELIIGEGGFGKVYMGIIKDGKKVAVKRSNPDHGQGLSEFQTEIMVLSKIRHKHLVSLIGYCYERGEMILVYEFMEKGTLRDHLYDSRESSDSTNCVKLSWKQRLEICIGAAKGLHYLHTGAERGIIHRDVKSTNILLDKHFVAKVADFGLSRLGHLEHTHVSTEVKGTFGYLDPDYFGCMQLTEKSDVYSFGVLLLEVLCARQVIDGSLPKEQVNLTEWAMACFRRDQIMNIIDPSLVGEIAENSLNKFVQTAVRCLNEYAVERPPMSDVLWDLEYALQLQKDAAGTELPGDSMTNVSLNMPLSSSPLLPSLSQSFLSVKDDHSRLNSTTGEVFSQLGFDDDSGR